MAALDGAFALPQVERVALAVAQHLDLDVARLLDKLLHEDAVVAKAVARLIAATAEAFETFLVVEGHAQALATTTGAGLDHHRVADALGDLDGFFRRKDGFVVTGNGVDPGRIRQLLGGDLVAHGGDRAMLGADEGDALFFDPARELLVLAQKAVAGVDGLGAGLLGCRDDLVGHQIGLAAGRRTQQHGLIGQLHMAGVLVGPRSRQPRS